MNSFFHDRTGELGIRVPFLLRTLAVGERRNAQMTPVHSKAMKMM
jgi:hypothetical protein